MGPRPPSSPPPPSSFGVPAKSGARRGPRPPSTANPEATFEYRNNSGLLRAGVIDPIPYGREQKPEGFLNKIKYTWNRKINEEKARERLLVCALAVSLLWSTSLLVIRGLIVYIIDSPSFDDVSTEVVKLKTVLDEQRFEYEECVADVFGDCITDFDIQTTLELNRITNLQDLNNATIEDADKNVSSCATNLDVVMSQIRLLQANQGLVVADNLNTLTDADDIRLCQSVIIESLSSNQLTAETAVELADVAANNTETSVGIFTDQLNERVQYDIDYFGTDLPGALDAEMDLQLNTHLQTPDDLFGSFNGTFDEMRACLNGGNFIDANGQEVLCPGDLDVLKGIDAKYDDFNQRFDELKTSADEAKTTVEKNINDFAKIVDDCKTTASIFKINGNGELFSDLNQPPFVAPEVDVGSIDQFVTSLDDLDIDTEEIDRLIAAANDEMAKAAEDAAAELAAIDADIRLQQLQFNQDLLADYNPPKLTYNDTNNESVANTTSIADRIAAELGYVPPSTEVVAQKVEAFRSNASATAANFLEDVKDRAFELFAYSEDFFVNFGLGLDDLEFYAYLFDTIWRVMQSLFLIKKYWGMSGIGTPPADCRSDKSAVFKEKKSPMALLAYYLVHPLTQLLQMMIFVTIITLLLYLAYEPMYSQYTEGCVLNGPKEIAIENNGVEGTMIYRNSLTTTRNYALEAGDKRIVEDVDQLNLQRSLFCADEFDISVQQRDLNIQDFENLNNLHDFLVVRYELFGTCINWTKIDAAHSSNFVDLVLGEDKQKCRDPLTPINVADDLLYNCSNVDQCDATVRCSGIPEGLLLSLNHDATCLSENALHAFLLGSVFSIAAYILLNVARLYFMRGVIGIWWKQITVNKYSYLASCTKMGTILYPTDVTEKGVEFRKIIKEKLDIALKDFGRYGYLELLFALVLNLPWMIMMAVLVPNLKFEQSN